MNDQDVESLIQERGLTAPRVTQQDVENEIQAEYYFTAQEGAAAAAYPPGPVALDLLTICVLVLRNGFTVIGQSACASPQNFDADIGRRIARKHALDTVWQLKGFELRTRLMEQQQTPQP